MLVPLQDGWLKLCPTKTGCFDSFYFQIMTFGPPFSALRHCNPFGIGIRSK